MPENIQDTESLNQSEDQDFSRIHEDLLKEMEECEKLFNEFKKDYHFFHPKEKKLFNVLAWFIDKFEIAFPTQQKLADMCKCTRKHVNETLKKFEEAGYFKSTYMHRQSKIYEFGNKLKNPTILERIRAFFKKRVKKPISQSKSYSEVTPCNPDYYVSGYGTKVETEDPQKGRNRWFKKVEMPHDLKGFAKIDLESACTLAAFSESIRQQALEIAKEYNNNTHKDGKVRKVTNVGKFMIGVCLDLCTKMKLKPDWSFKGKLRRIMGLYTG